MSYITDALRAPYRTDTSNGDDPNSLEAIVAANPSRRTILRNGLFGLSILPVAAMLASTSALSGHGELYDDSRNLSTLSGRPTTPISETIAAALKG